MSRSIGLATRRTFLNFQDLSFRKAPSIKTSVPGPKSREYLESQATIEGSVVSYPKGVARAVGRAWEATFEDVAGNVYIDFLGGAGVMNVGHGNPGVVKAA